MRNSFFTSDLVYKRRIKQASTTEDETLNIWKFYWLNLTHNARCEELNKINIIEARWDFDEKFDVWENASLIRFTLLSLAAEESESTSKLWEGWTIGIDSWEVKHSFPSSLDLFIRFEESKNRKALFDNSLIQKKHFTIEILSKISRKWSEKRVLNPLWEWKMMKSLCCRFSLKMSQTRFPYCHSMLSSPLDRTSGHRRNIFLSCFKWRPEFVLERKDQNTEKDCLKTQKLHNHLDDWEWERWWFKAGKIAEM